MSHTMFESSKMKSAWGWQVLCGVCLCAATAFAAPENWPQTYNAGVAAYRTNDFATAATAFERALPATDRDLQAKAFFNLGNTSYRLGEAQPGDAQELWKRAIQHYEQALVLNPDDADAKFNRDFVKRKLAELEKQQQEKQQQKDQQSQDQKDKDQKQQNQQDQQSGQQPQPESSEQGQQQESAQQQPLAESSPKPTEQSQASEAQARMNNEPFDKQQARALLDQMREEERLWDFHPELQMKNLKDAGGPVKDW